MPVRDKQRAQGSVVVAVTPAADVVRRRNELVRTCTLCLGNCRPIANAAAGRGIAHAVGVARLEGKHQPAAAAALPQSPPRPALHCICAGLCAYARLVVYRRRTGLRGVAVLRLGGGVFLAATFSLGLGFTFATRRACVFTKMRIGKYAETM